MALVDIAAQLEEPFPLEDIELLPKGSVERDGKTLCMAMPYADVRVYQDRLNKLAPGEWSTPPPLALVVGTKLVCYVTIVIYGVSHTDVGEAGPGENQGTEAFAQAFKRACSQVGLGRYLYNLEKAWVPYNPKKKQIDLDAAGVKSIARQMYQKAGVFLSQGVPPQNGHNENGNAPPTSAPTARLHRTPLVQAMVDARDAGMITGTTKEERTASWEEQVIMIFGKLIEAAEQAKPENIKKINAAITRHKGAAKSA